MLDAPLRTYEAFRAAVAAYAQQIEHAEVWNVEPHLAEHGDWGVSVWPRVLSDGKGPISWLLRHETVQIVQGRIALLRAQWNRLLAAPGIHVYLLPFPEKAENEADLFRPFRSFQEALAYAREQAKATGGRYGIICESGKELAQVGADEESWPTFRPLESPLT